jgi:hypothetical protein
MREVRWERMFSDELERAFAACPLVYFAYGLCEPHGPQNAVGLDGLKAHAIACAAARAHGGIVAPPDYWHIHELGSYATWAARAVGEVPRAWLTSMPPWMHFKNICYHLRAADALGFHAAILLTGHYGPNWQDLKTLLELVQPYVGARLYGLPDFEANQPGFASDGRSGGDHAGRVETSLLWAVEPERMVADEVRWLGAKAQDLLAAYATAVPAQRLRTFEDVEALWETVVRPRLKEFRTMQPLPAEGVPEASVWRANAGVPERG